jgi:aryl-alcohol dehydrogenase-like predicted oxidoreductase
MVADMRYRPLGSTGMQVSEYCLGAMMYGGWGNTDHDDCIRQIHTALDTGINFIDVADVYARGESEEIVAKAIKGKRDNLVIATKVNGVMGDDILQRGNSRRWIMKEVEDSLRRLETDWIDLYQIHRPDPSTDIEETLSALTDLVHQGKVRAIGSSTFPADQIVEAQWAAERRGLERFRCEQPPYSMFVRGIEETVLPACERYGMGVIVWSPLAAGWLTGRYRTTEDINLEGGRAARFPSRFDPTVDTNLRKLDLVAELDKVAIDAGTTLTHLAVAFVLAHRAVTSVIIGPRTAEQLDDLIAGFGGERGAKRSTGSTPSFRQAPTLASRAATPTRRSSTRRSAATKDLSPGLEPGPDRNAADPARTAEHAGEQHDEVCLARPVASGDDGVDPVLPDVIDDCRADVERRARRVVPRREHARGVRAGAIRAAHEHVATEQAVPHRVERLPQHRVVVRVERIWRGEHHRVVAERRRPVGDELRDDDRD